MTLGIDLHASSLSTLTRQGLCQLLDPQDPMGRDWCLLAVKMGLADKVPRLEGETKGQSQMAKILDEWEAADARNTIGESPEANSTAPATSCDHMTSFSRKAY